MDRHVEADDAPVAVADDNRALDPQLTHQRDRVLRHVVVMERTIGEVGSSPVPHLLRRDQSKSRREERDPLLGDRAAATVEQEQRRAVSVGFVVHVEPVDGDVGHWRASDGVAVEDLREPFQRHLVSLAVAAAVVAGVLPVLVCDPGLSEVVAQ